MGVVATGTSDLNQAIQFGLYLKVDVTGTEPSRNSVFASTPGLLIGPRAFRRTLAFGLLSRRGIPDGIRPDSLYPKRAADTA